MSTQAPPKEPSTKHELALVVGDMVFDQQCTMTRRIKPHDDVPFVLEGADARQLASEGRFPEAWSRFGSVHCNLKTDGLSRWSTFSGLSFVRERSRWEFQTEASPVMFGLAGIPFLCWVDALTSEGGTSDGGGTEHVG